MKIAASQILQKIGGKRKELAHKILVDLLEKEPPSRLAFLVELGVFLWEAPGKP